jgi:hypothetical protein
MEGAAGAVHACGLARVMAGATSLYDRMGEWQDEQKPAFSMKVRQFIQAAGKARRVG